jgi:hypothetical protein
VSKGTQKQDERDDLDGDVDALFRLPLAEFTGARNALAAKLKKSGRGDDAAGVKALGKPSVSAWAVNQLYWSHRAAFDRLVASGERFHKAQTSRSAAKVADIRATLEARRADLSKLSDIAASLLQDAGHNPSLDTIRRVTATLEGISAFAARSDVRHPWSPGRLTEDVDPPGFESFASFVPVAGVAQSKEQAGRRLTAGRTSGETSKLIRFPQKSTSAATNTPGKMAPGDDPRQLEEKRKQKIAAAKVSLQDAKRSLTEARAKAHRLAAAQKKADAEEQKAEQRRRDAEASLEKATAALEGAAERARSVAVDAKEAANAVEDAEGIVEKAAKELAYLLAESQ